jgi:hypothetical protein
MAVVFPTHTTHFFPKSGPDIIKCFEDNQKTTHGDFCDDSVRDQIAKLLQADEQVTTSFTIRVAFKKAGFFPDVRSKPIRLVFNEGILCENPGLSEFWNCNIPVDQLSRRRQSHRFGLFNADFLARLPDEQTAFGDSLCSRHTAKP